MVWRTLLFGSARYLMHTTPRYKLSRCGRKNKGKKNNLFLRLSIRHHHHLRCVHIFSLPLVLSLSHSIYIYFCLFLWLSSCTTLKLSSSVPKSTGVTTAKGAFHQLNISNKKKIITRHYTFTYTYVLYTHRRHKFIPYTNIWVYTTIAINRESRAHRLILERIVTTTVAALYVYNIIKYILLRENTAAGKTWPNLTILFVLFCFSIFIYVYIYILRVVPFRVHLSI